MVRALRLLASCALFSQALAHSHILYLIINGQQYRGFNPHAPDAITNSIGWSTSAVDDGFVTPFNYSSPDIICHRDGKPAKAHAPVKAGDKIQIQWNGWPQSHKGPVLSYLSPCANTTDGCASVDKRKLSWTKIDDSSPVLLDEKGGPPGRWATDVLIAQNNTWLLGLPNDLEPGPYVLRHELIALHYANLKNGAQNYPQCVNLWVEVPGSKTATVGKEELVVAGQKEGVPATALYKATDPGVAIDIYTTLSTYVIPGPTLAPEAKPVPVPEQGLKSTITAVGTPVVVTRATSTVPMLNGKTAAAFKG
ncbi:endo-1,4-beta-glucanase [Neurospora intermedia]|uniref:lytic cellulose monooxygenase (C4-dehydrogenating) n=1 Tax=Neurospora intermedia TaxID=5142 RepID=A0ABR3DJS5_NEUIN